MTGEAVISDELLNAYMDGELTAEDRARVSQALSQDPELRAYYCHLRGLRDRVRAAYPAVKSATVRRDKRARQGRLRRSAVAAALVLLGGMGGWVGHALTGIHGPGEPLALSGVLHAPQEAQDQQARMMLHVTTGDARAIGEALREVEGLLQEYRRVNQDFSLRVVVNGDGLRMLRADAAPHPDWIQRLHAEHDNVQFLACQNAIKRVEGEEGLTVELLPEAAVVPVAMADIIQRQREGWSYIKI